MPEFDSTTRTKIAALRTLVASGGGPQVFELCKISWTSDPADAVYYSVMQTDEIADPPPPVSPIEVRLIPDGSPDWFLPVQMDSTIGDEEVELAFWDADGVISDLLVANGEGCKIELFYWLPQVELLLPLWHGHLRFEDEATVDIIKLKAVQGFRSADATAPHRAHWQECQAVFGGVLDTQEAIDDNDCPFNAHIGGSIGTNDPGTGLPWTFCPRRTQADCDDRLGTTDGRYHLSHRTIELVRDNPQSRGPRLYSISRGNETNLKEPVRVVMGERRVYDMRVMAYRRDQNNRDPDHGWFLALYEGCEGPVQNISQAIIEVKDVAQNADPHHFGWASGEIGQTEIAELTTHSYSGTALISYNFGWVDPAGIQAGDASANAFFKGLANIRIYEDPVAAGNGLIGRYYLNDDFATGLRIVRVETDLNFPSSTNFVRDVGPGFTGRYTGRIKPRYTETYTFELHHDDDALLRIKSGGTWTTIVNQVGVGTATGTIALTADTEYDIEVTVSNKYLGLNNPWELILKWQSATQALEVVPNSRLFHDAVTPFYCQHTRNRAWQIARSLCDKRWGYGYDYERLNMDSWRTAADWVETYIRYTDSFGTNWDHFRSISDVELISKKVQQQIEDLCMAGRLSRPFLFDGKIHIVPLRALTEDELDECPVFTDEGSTGRNVIFERDGDVEKSTLKISRKSDLDLPNRIECTYDSANNAYQETPLQPVEDIDQQLRAGRVVGDKSRKINKKQHSLLGVTVEAQAVKMAWSLLDLGPFDEGGLQNNLKLTFKIWFMDALDLHPYKVIRFNSSRLTRYGFTYFRIMKVKRLDSLQYEIEAQAYNETYMATFETEISSPYDPGTFPPTTEPGPTPSPCILTFGNVSWEDGKLNIPIDPC
jgi:hypothetical protein